MTATKLLRCGAAHAILQTGKVRRFTEVNRSLFLSGASQNEKPLCASTTGFFVSRSRLYHYVHILSNPGYGKTDVFFYNRDTDLRKSKSAVQDIFDRRDFTT